MLEEFYYMFFVRSMNRTRKWSFGFKTNPINEVAVNAYISVSFFQLINVYCAWRIVSNFNIVFISENMIAKYAALVVFLIVLINYFFLYRKRKEIMISIDSLSVVRIKRGKVFFVVYVFASLLLFGFVCAN